MKRNSLWIMLLVLAVALAGCGNTANEANNEVNATAGATTKPEASATSDTDTDAKKETTYPLTIKDASGVAVTFTKAPQRIVSTSPSETEVLFALGLGEQVVGISDFDNFPKEVESKPKVGGVSEPNAEAILAQSPDLVISGISIKDTAYEELRSLGLVLIRTDPKTLEDVLGNITLIGQIANKQVEAETLVAQMREDIRKVTEAAATVKPEDKKKVYIEFSPGWTVGKGEFLDELITLAGGINIASDLEGWNPINEEKIIADNPDVIIYPLNITDDKSGKKLEDLIQQRSGWDQIKAIVDKQMVGVDKDALARPGPRITQALLELSEGIYPGLVKSE